MNAILNEIHAIVGDAGIITGEDVHQRPADFFGREKCHALAIVRPASTHEISAVLKVCNASNQPIVPAGGMTGLVKGTIADEREMILSLERMTVIESVDPLERIAVVQAGATLQAVQDAANDKGLQFAVDLGSRGSCTIGGNISTNAGGNQVLRYGMTREQVLGLEVVLANGQTISAMNTLLKNNAGYDLKQLFIGSEGTLGVVSRAVLRLRPKPHSKNTAIVGVRSFAALTQFFAFAEECFTGVLTAFEVMWREHYLYTAVTTEGANPPLPDDFKFYVVVETQGSDEQRDAEQFAEILNLAIERKLIADAVVARSEAQRSSLWQIRENVGACVLALAPVFVFDVSLPISTMGYYVESVNRDISNELGDHAKTVAFSHLGDGNLHLIISVGDGSLEARRKVEALVYTPLQTLCGSVSAEHGVGLEKRDYIPLSRTENEIALMRTLKATLDPKNILNRGKVFPSRQDAAPDSGLAIFKC